MGLPPIPPFEGLHPIVVHFPIGILLIAWLPMLIALADKKRRHAWFASAAMLLIVGTLGAFAAVLTGEATEDIVGASSQVIHDAIHEHEEAAELARNLFIAATLVFLVVWGVGAKINEKKRAMVGIVGGVLVVGVYGFAAVALMNAGHLGGVLVHQHGIHAPLGSATVPAPSGNATPPAAHDEDDD